MEIQNVHPKYSALKDGQGNVEIISLEQRTGNPEGETWKDLGRVGEVSGERCIWTS